MFPIKGRKTGLTREKISIMTITAAVDEMKVINEDDPWYKQLRGFLDFLLKLDPSRYEIYHEKEVTEGGSREGWLVVHFPVTVTESWNNTWQTWFGLSATMF